MQNPATETGARLAAMTMGLDPDVILGSLESDPLRDSSVRLICKAASLVAASCGLDAFAGRMEKAASCPAGPSDAETEAAETVVLVLAKRANALAQLFSVFSGPSSAIGRIIPGAKWGEGATNAYLQALGASALVGAGTGAMTWHGRRSLEKEEEDVEKVRAQHLMLRQMIGDAEQRMQAREEGSRLSASQPVSSW